MGNRSKPVINKDDITDEERARLLNRQKCRQYRANHRERYREYQRQYKANNTERPSVVYHKLKYRIAFLHQVIERWRQTGGSRAATYIGRSLVKIAELEKRIEQLNYTEVYTKPGV